METSGVYRYKTTTSNEINLDNALIHLKGTDPNSVEGSFSFQIMILEGDHTQTPLEELPFIESIESTGDKSKNLVKSIVVDMNHSDGNYVCCEGSHVLRSSIIKLPKGRYSLSFEKFAHSEIQDGAVLIWDNTESTTWKRKGSFKQSFEILEDEVGVTWYSSFSTKERKDEVVGSFIQIEEGETATPYQEYYDGYKISGKSFGKNLWKPVLHTKANAECEIQKDKVIVTGKADTNWNNVRLKVKVKKNTDYFFSFNCDNPNGYISCRAKDLAIIKDFNKSSARFNSGENEDIFFLMHSSLNTAGIHVVEYNNIQLEEATTPTPYEPYQESSYEYISSEPLRSLPNGVCDTIDLATGVIARRVGKYTLKGTEPFSIASEVTGNVMCLYSSNNNLKINRVSRTNNIMCDKMAVYKYGLHTDIEGIMASDTCIIVSFKNVSDYNEAIEKLKSNPVTFYYELAEPTTEQLTPCQLKSFDTTTHIISDNKLMPIVSTKIPSNVNAVVQNLKAENKKLEKQLDSAIEELNNTDVDLLAMDWETDYRLCELEWTILDTMKVETLTENKVLENRILSRYEQAKILIESGKYNKTTMEKQLTTYHNRGCLTDEEYNELMELMNR